MNSTLYMYSLLLMNIVGVLMVMSSKSWVGIWFGLELSGFSFPPLLMKMSHSKISLVNCWKYILVQSYCSCFMIVGFFGFSFSGIYFLSGNIQWIILLMSTLIKMGLPPFHGWMMQISNSMSWFSFLILSTIQKIGPMILLSQVMIDKEVDYKMELLYLMIMLFSIAGAFVSCVRFFLINSSSLNIAWMMSVIYFSKYIMFFYMLVYFIHLFLLISFMEEKFNLLGSMFYIGRVGFLSSFIVQIIIYSMVGIPPLIGFFMKTMLVSVLLEEMMVYMCMWMLFMSGLFSFVYISMIVMFLMKESMELKFLNYKSFSSLFSLFILMIWVFWFFV